MPDLDGSAEPDGRLELSAPATPEMLDLVHAMLERLWADHDEVSIEDRIRFETAVIEILGNIVEHAYRADEVGAHASRRFDIMLVATDTTLLAAFGDNGMPVALDMSGVVMPDEDAESGRGLAMAAAAVDEMSYDRVDGRNHWRLMCTRRPA